MRRRHHDETVREIAAALDVAPDQLDYFRECHPNPTVETVLALADRPPVDEETRESIDEWLADEAGDDDQASTLGGDPTGLLFDRAADSQGGKR